MRTEALSPGQDARIQETAELLYQVFQERSPDWLSSIGAAVAEVRESL